MRSSTKDRIDALESNAREVAELAAEVRRLAIAVEQRLRSPLPERIEMPRPARVPTSWHQMIREKQVSVPRAAAWSTFAYVLVELARALVDGRLRFW